MGQAYTDGIYFSEGSFEWYVAETPIDIQSEFGDTLTLSGDQETGWIITLNGFNFETSCTMGFKTEEEDITFVVKSDSSITSGDGESASGIDAYNVTVQGDEGVTFTVACGTGNYSTGVYVADLVIDGGITVKAISGPGTESSGIWYGLTPSVILIATDDKGNLLTFDEDKSSYVDSNRNYVLSTILTSPDEPDPDPEITVATEEKWFKAGDTVTISGTITDKGGSGIQKLELTGIGATPIALEYDKNYNWSYTYTGADTKGTALTFTVTDNNDNTAEAAYNLKVDTVAPTLKFYFTEPTYKDTATGINWYKKSTAATTFTASATDATSGVASITHDGTESEGYAWSTDIDCSKETAVPVTIKAYATDNAGNSCEEQSFTYCVDGTGPAITVSQSPVVSQGFFSVCVTASAEDAGSGVDYIEYQIGGGAWTLYDAEEGVVVDDTTTINFRAYDKLGNVNFESYTMTRPAGAIVIDGEVDDAIQYARISEDRTPITIQNNGVLVVNDTVDALNTDSLTLIAGGKLSINGTFNAQALTVQGTENVVAGNLVEFSTVALAAGSAVTINRTQYEYLLANADFTESTDGKLIVTPVTGKSLRVADIDALMNKTNLAGVDFLQDLIDINKLDFKSTKATFIGLKDAYGTSAGDTIRFRKNTEITLGAAGREINLEEGNNTIQIDQAAQVAVKSNLLNVSTVKVDKLSKAEFADITFADGRSAKFTAESLTTVSAGIITAGDKALTLNVKKGVADNETTFGTCGIIGSAKADTLDFGTYTSTLVLGNGVDGFISLGDGNDQLKIAKDSNFRLDGGLDFGAGKDVLTINNRSKVYVSGVVTGLNKLAVNNGSYDKKTDTTTWTELTTGNVTGTEYSDTFAFGNYCKGYSNAINFGDGNDTLQLGNYGEFRVDDLLDFGDGTNDKLSIGKGSTLTVGNLDVDSLDKLTMGKDALLVIGDADALAAAQEKWAKYADQIVSKLA